MSHLVSSSESNGFHQRATYNTLKSIYSYEFEAKLEPALEPVQYR